MDNIIFYKEYMKRKILEQKKLSCESEKYAKYWSILNRLIDWEVMDMDN